MYGGGQDPDYRKMINTGAWRRLRHETLLHHPLCVRCEAEGRVTAATEVHHTVPVQSGMNAAEKQRLMFSASNLEPLCHDCHVKAHIALGRSGSKYARRKNEADAKAFNRKFFDD